MQDHFHPQSVDTRQYNTVTFVILLCCISPAMQAYLCRPCISMQIDEGFDFANFAEYFSHDEFYKWK